MRALAAAALLLVSGPASAGAGVEASDVHYADADPLQVGDLRLPPGDGPFPLAIVIHGGCWLSGVATRSSTAALAESLAEAGVATWNVEYRRVGDAGGGWPGTFRDVGAATDYVRTLAQKYPIDLARVVVVGHSAGAHLALWVAARAKLPPTSELRGESPLPLRGVVALAGPGDLRTLAGRNSICGRGTLEKLAGGSIESVPQHWADASPAALLPLGVPQTLVVGKEDSVVPSRIVASYEKEARAAGDVTKLVVVDGADHMDMIEPLSRAGRTVKSSVLELTSR